jgi:hypothetical protein
VDSQRFQDHGGVAPDVALSVWVVEQQEATVETLTFQTLLFLRYPARSYLT